MGAGKDFEDALMDALEEWVADDGYPMLRKQTMAQRRGQFQMGQELDIMVDSRHENYYIGLEAKSRDTENGLGMYFSKLNPKQFLGQEEYREVSGRKVAVAVELRNCCGPEDDANDCGFLVPLDLFVNKVRNDATKVSWEEVREHGVYLGCNGDFEFTDAHFDALERGQDTNRDTDVVGNEEMPEPVPLHEPTGEQRP